MIQELLGEAAAGVLIGGEKSKLSVSTGVLGGSSTSPSPSPSPSLSPSSSTVTPPPTGSTSENLRCPRCDSTNTKFCYYNNYNLTQPRHFCKTCRRYWTKGGALRNVPIGGGCRKNKNSTITSAVIKSSAGKFKTVATDIGKSGFLSGFEHELSSSPSSNPIMWASPQNSHLLSLLRATQNPNPNPNSANISKPIASIKEEEAAMPGSHMNSAIGLINSSSLWRNNDQQQQIGYVVGEGQSGGVQDFYQRLRSSTYCYPDPAPVVLGNVVSSSSSSSSSAHMTILDSAPVGAAEPGYWNPILSSWSDLPTTNGAYP